MPRTTVDIETAVLRDLKRLSKREGKPLGRLISELVSSALSRGGASGAKTPPFVWAARRMRARIALEDKEAVRAVLDAP